MAWLRIESSVSRNCKFLRAGPAASWLWVCGIAYCQEGLTDGFIPREALPTLGVVKDADRLATKLVIAGLWEACEDGGWLIHDYLEHNRSASDIAAIRAARAAGGKHGGRPTKKPFGKPSHITEGLTTEPLCETFPVAVADDVAGDVVVGAEKESDAPPIDQWLFDLQNGLYPSHRVSRSARTAHAFTDAMQGYPGGSTEAFRVFCANLSDNIQSHEWRVKGMIPSLEKYVLGGLWLNVHPKHPPIAERLTKGTNRTLEAAAEIMREP